MLFISFIIWIILFSFFVLIIKSIGGLLSFFIIWIILGTILELFMRTRTNPSRFDYKIFFFIRFVSGLVGWFLLFSFFYSLI
jgi:hypothetical protein